MFLCGSTLGNSSVNCDCVKCLATPSPISVVIDLVERSLRIHASGCNTGGRTIALILFSTQN